MDISPQLNAIAKERENLQPTPPVGTPIIWYDRNNVESPYAARVTAIEAPGRLRCEIVKPGAFAIHKEGVLYTGNAIHANPNNPTTVNKGAFDYISGARPPKADYKAHEDLLKRREDNLYRDQQAFEDAKAAKEQREAEKKAKQQEALSAT